MSPRHDDPRQRELDLDERLRRDAERVRAVPPPALKDRVLGEVARLGGGGRPVRVRGTRSAGLLPWGALAAAVLVFALLRAGVGSDAPAGPGESESAVAASSADGLDRAPGTVGGGPGATLSGGPLLARGTRRVGELTRALDGALVSELENLFLDFSLAAERVAERLPLPRVPVSRPN